MKYYKLEDFNNRNVRSHSSGFPKSNIKMLGGWFLLRPAREVTSQASPWLVDGHLHVDMAFSLLYEAVSQFFLYKDISHI